MFVRKEIFVVLSSILVQLAVCGVSSDLSSLPGHLKPLATGRPIFQVEEVQGFPEPSEFFEKFVKSTPKKAVIFKGGAKLSPAYSIWSDEYLENHPDSGTMEFDVEIGKKEDRKGNMQKRSVKDFIGSYKTDNIYAVTDVPKQLKDQFLLPPAIRCENIKDTLSMMLMWFSSGGTRSVLHHDSFENINCLFRGSKRLLLAEYPKYVKDVVIDRPNGYSSVDVDKVDFVKYPGLSKVDFWEANMKQGDCLYIPYNWFHQVNSFPNENKTNMAVNVWWHRNDSYVPNGCGMKAEEATLDKFKFLDSDAQESEGGEGGEGTVDFMGIFNSYIKEKNAAEISYDEFLEDIQKTEDSTLYDVGVADIPNKKRREKFAKMFYDALDIDNNGVVDYNDYNSEDDELAADMGSKVQMVAKKLDKYFAWLEKKNPDAGTAYGKGRTEKDAKDEL